MNDVIIGNTTATPNPRPDWIQTDETRADYIKNKPNLTNTSLAFEGNTVDKSSYSIAAGKGNQINGKNSMVIGENNQIYSNSSFVSGKNNELGLYVFAVQKCQQGDDQNSLKVTIEVNKENENKFSYEINDVLEVITSGGVRYSKPNNPPVQIKNIQYVDIQDIIQIELTLKEIENDVIPLYIGVLGKWGPMTYGSHSLISGLNNTSYADYVIVNGRNNNNTGAGSMVTGQSNRNHGSLSCVSGYQNSAYNKGNFVHGRFLRTSREWQTIFGQYNKIEPDVLFMIGNGTSEENRKNAFTVTSDAVYSNDVQLATVNTTEKIDTKIDTTAKTLGDKITGIENVIKSNFSSGQIKRIIIDSVDNLPEASNDNKDIICMIKNQNNAYDEYMLLTNSSDQLEWKIIGTTEATFDFVANKSLVFDTEIDLDNWLTFKNICPLPAEAESSLWQIRHNDDGTFYLKIDNSSGLTIVTVTVEPGATYTFSSNIEGLFTYINDFIYNGDSFVVPDDQESINIYLPIDSEGEEIEKAWIQLEKGTVVTDFTPYGQAPSREDGITKSDLNIGDLLIVKEPKSSYYWDGTNINSIESIIPDNIRPWSANTEYKVGDIVIGNIVYEDFDEKTVIAQCVKGHKSKGYFSVTIGSYYEKVWEIIDEIKSYYDGEGRCIHETYLTKDNIANGANNKALYQLSEKDSPTEEGFYTYKAVSSFSFGELPNEAKTELINRSIGIDGSKYCFDKDTQTGVNALSLGTNIAYGKRSFAVGSSNIAGDVTQDNTSTSSSATALGSDNYAKGKSSVAMGYSNYTAGEYSIASGARNQALANGAHAQGMGTIAYSEASHAEGFQTQAGKQDDNKELTGYYSHAEGSETKALGICSHAEGNHSEAIGHNSHAGGLYTKATVEAQTAIGKYNAEEPNALFIVGNGTGDSENNRSNAFVVKNDGTVIAGNTVMVGDEELITKTEVSNIISNEELITKTEVSNIINSFVGVGTNISQATDDNKFFVVIE